MNTVSNAEREKKKRYCWQSKLSSELYNIRMFGLIYMALGAE